jgi:hypothetical protein
LVVVILFVPHEFWAASSMSDTEPGQKKLAPHGAQESPFQ